MALSISTLNHFSSTRFPSHFTILSSSSSSSSLVPFSPARLSVPAIPKRRRFLRISASGDDNSQRSGQLPSLSPEVLVLNVEGMMCEGCADSVKKLLESRPQVSSATVNLTEKVATVWPAPEAKNESNWLNKLGVGLAEHLTNCGFKSSLQGQKDSN